MSQSVWFPFSKPLETSKVPVFCFPHAGSGASCFRDWQSQPQDLIEFVPVELPGRETRFPEKPYQEMGDLIEDFCRDLSSFIQPNSIFFGHSFGAYIAFELALRFRDRNAHLVVSGSSAPSRKRTRRIAHLPDEQLISEIHSYGGIPQELFGCEELLEIFLPILRADLTLFENYQPKLSSKISGSLAAIGGSLDSLAPPHSLAMWEEHTLSSFDYFQIEGGHFFHKEKPNIMKKTVEKFIIKTKFCK